MKKLLILFLSFFPLILFGQSKKKFSLIATLQPELTFHKNNYAFRWRETYTKATFNTGLGFAIQYNLTEKIFVDAGIGYIPRRLATTAFLDHCALPSQGQICTSELVTTKSVSYRTMEFPLNFGYTFFKSGKTNLFMNLGLTGNYILNAYYETGNFDKYQGRYKKNYWQGYSVNLGVGTDYKLKRNVSTFGRITYSIRNTMKADEYLFSQDQYVISLPHKYLSLSIGIKSPIKP